MLGKTPMRSVEISINQSELPRVLNTMRVWLDARKATVSLFRISSIPDSGIVVVHADFGDAEISAAFREQFGQAGAWSDDGERQPR
jgi:hypothetical protein